MTPQTKIAVFNGIAEAVTRFGDIEAAAEALGVRADRLDGVARDKLPIPPQWVDGLIAFGEGRVSCDGFKMMRERYYQKNGMVKQLVGSTARKGRNGSSHLENHKLIRLVGQKLRLIPPNQGLPLGAIFVSSICNRPVYIDGKLRETFFTVQVLEPHLNDGKIVNKVGKSLKK